MLFTFWEVIFFFFSSHVLNVILPKLNKRQALTPDSWLNTRGQKPKSQIVWWAASHDSTLGFEFSLKARTSQNWKPWKIMKAASPAVPLSPRRHAHIHQDLTFLIPLEMGGARPPPSLTDSPSLCLLPLDLPVRWDKSWSLFKSQLRSMQKAGHTFLQKTFTVQLLLTQLT